jgi:lipopolysaccharide export LptBFGC system permease protein LptF
LPELLERKAYLDKQPEVDRLGNLYPVKPSLKKVRLEIAKRIAFPFTLLEFYIAGIFMGLSFYKTYRLIPALLSWFIITSGWFMLYNLFQVLYNRERINFFPAAYGTQLLLAVILVFWYWALRKYGFFTKGKADIPDDFLSGSNL